MSTEKDPLDDVLADLGGDDDDDKTGLLTPDDLAALKAQLEEKEKKITGLLKEAQSQRKKRQETESKLDDLTKTVTGILAHRQTVPVVQTPAQKVDKVLKGDYDADGNPVVDVDQVKALHADELKSLNNKIASLEALLQAQVSNHQAESEGQKTINAIVGSDERFGPAFNKYQNARKWVEDKVIEYQRENNIGGIITSGQALDEIFDDTLEADFAAKFPNMNLEKIVTAEDSKRHFRNALSSIAETMAPQGNDDTGSKRISTLLKKPSGLGKSTNAKGSEMNIIERLKSISTQDLLEMTDDQAKAIERALAKTE